MLEGIVREIQDDKVLIETEKGNVTLPVFAFDHVPQTGEKIQISVSNDGMAKRVINELLTE
ncbi:MAG: hypothetical protein WCW31_02375 [Patescibacteria group bacterium]|jgi:hypothetical protein